MTIFSLKDNSDKPFNHLFDNVDLSVIDNLTDWIKVTAQGLINGSCNDQSDSVVFSIWLESGELDQILAIAQEIMIQPITTANGQVTITIEDKGYRVHSPYESQSADSIEQAFKIACDMTHILNVGWENS